MRSLPVVKGSLASFLNVKFLSLSHPLLIIVLVVLGICILSYVRKQLTLSGCVAAFCTGVGITWGLGFGALIVMLFFFLTGGVASRLSKGIRGSFEKKGSCRDSLQVLANGGLALFFSLLYLKIPHELFVLLFATAVAEATSDTISGDIGVLSREIPVSIVTGMPVKKGVGGGVTAFGLSAGIISSVLVALVWMCCFFTPSGHAFLLAAMVGVSGFAGAVFDSYLGGSVQALYKDEEGRLTEREGSESGKYELVRGLKWMNNDMVNFLANLFACMVLLLIYSLLF